MKPPSKPSGVRNYADAVKNANSNSPPVSPSLDHVISKINLLVDEVKSLKKDITELKERPNQTVTFDDTQAFLSDLKDQCEEPTPSVEFVCNNFDGIMLGMALLKNELTSIRNDIDKLKPPVSKRT